MKNLHLLTLRFLPLLILLFLLNHVGSSAAESKITRVRASEFGSTLEVVGSLGLPIGQQVTIRGVKRQVPKSSDTFEVYEVDGKRLAKSIYISVPQTESWDDGLDGTFEGYEQGTLKFLHAYDTGMSVREAERFKPRQILYTHFEVTRVRNEKPAPVQR